MVDFSVLMSVYHKEKPEYLRQSFDSIYQQSVAPTEIILVEDGPLTPSLYEAISREEQRFPQLRRVVLPTNQGLGVALNKGLEACSYDLVARMDTDDISTPDRFQVQLAFMQQHPEVDVLSAWITEFDHEPSNVVGIRNLPEQHHDIFLFGKKRNPINHPVVMFRRQAVIKAGGYQPCYLFEDYYLWVRMLQGGHRFHNLQQSLLLFRRSPEMIRRRGGLTYARNEILFLKKLRETGYISTYRLVRNILQRFFIRLLPNCLRSFIDKHLLRTIP